jgi:hypothetical protein
MKKYSETFINNTDLLKHARIGFEFEFYMTDLSYYKTLELLNQYLTPVKVWGFRQYHSDFTPDAQNFKIEPDLSGGSNMVELVTGPMNYFEAKHYLIKIIKFIQDYGYTNEKSSIHFNLSFNEESDKNLNSLNILKLILSIDEEEIYRVFPSRKGNVYAKSVKKIIPFKEFDFNSISTEIIKNTLRLPNDKYYGINFLHINNSRDSQRLEFRYIGGKDYEKNTGQLIYFMDRFIIDTYKSIGSSFTKDEMSELEEILSTNISNFKNLSKYDNFIIDFPSIVLQVDQNYIYDLVNAYYPRMYSKLFTLIDSTDSLKDCIINYTTATQRFEIVDAQVKITQNINDFDFINCRIQDGIFENCHFVNSEINNCQIVKSKLHGSEVNKTKLLNCNVEASTIKDCFFMNGYLNSDMIGGVFRSGKLGPYANISSETKIVTQGNNFFDTSYEDDEKYDYKKDKGVISAFKK